MLNISLPPSLPPSLTHSYNTTVYTCTRQLITNTDYAKQLTTGHWSSLLPISTAGQRVMDVLQDRVFQGKVDRYGDVEKQQTPLQLTPLLGRHSVLLDGNKNWTLQCTATHQLVAMSLLLPPLDGATCTLPTDTNATPSSLLPWFFIWTLYTCIYMYMCICAFQ